MRARARTSRSLNPQPDHGEELSCVAAVANLVCHQLSGNEACCLGKGIPCLARPVVS